MTDKFTDEELSENLPDWFRAHKHQIGVEAFSTFVSGLFAFALSSYIDPIMAIGLGSATKASSKLWLEGFFKHPKVKIATQAALEEMEKLNRGGSKLRPDLTGEDGGYKEVLDAVYRQIFDEPEAKKQKHLGIMIARSTEDSGVSWNTIQSLLKVTESLTFEDLKILSAFNQMGNPSGWREGDLKYLDELIYAEITRLRNHALLTTISSGFERDVSITDFGTSLCFLMGLNDIEDLKKTAEEVDPFLVIYEHNTDEISFRAERFDGPKNSDISITCMTPKNAQILIQADGPTQSWPARQNNQTDAKRRTRLTASITIPHNEPLNSLTFDIDGNTIKYDVSDLPQLQPK